MSEPIVVAGVSHTYENVQLPSSSPPKSAPSTTTVDETPWLFGKIERDEVAELFRDNGMKDGQFIVRASTRTDGDYVLSFAMSDKVQHFVITPKSGQFQINDGPKFDSLAPLVAHYTQDAGCLPIRLKTPILRNPPPKAAPPVVAAEELDNYEVVDLPKQNLTRAPSLPRRSDPLPPIPGEGPKREASFKREGSIKTDSPPPLPPGRGSFDSETPPVIIAEEGGNPYAFSQPLQSSSPPTQGISQNRSSIKENPSPLSRGMGSMKDNVGGGNLARQGSLNSNNSTGTLTKGAKLNPNVEVNARGVAIVKNRDGFEELPQVKEWKEKNDQIANVSIKTVQEKRRQSEFSADATRLAEERDEAFNKQAQVEEKMYLFWLNNQLKKIGKSVEDIGPSIKNGVYIIEALKLVSGKKPPAYVSNPRVPAQEFDNWQVIIKFMRSLKIAVDNNPTEDPDVEGTGLDASALYSLDRREILKLFSKILFYENNLK